MSETEVHLGPYTVTELSDGALFEFRSADGYAFAVLDFAVTTPPAVKKDTANLFAASHKLREALRELVDAANADASTFLPWYCPATLLIEKAGAALAAAEPPETEGV